MQEFETYEVINLLRNYDNKKFELIGGTKNLNYLGIKAMNSNGYLQIISKNEREILNLNEMTAILLHGKWIEVKESVDFMTAVSSGKRIKVVHPLVCDLDYTTIRKKLERLSVYFNEYDLKDIIINGKWYIED